MHLGTPPPAGDYEAPAEGIQEVLVTNITPKPKAQKYWRDQSKPEGQFEWDLVIRDGDDKDKPLKLWTGDAIGRHPKNKLVKVLKVVDPEFTIDKATELYHDDFDTLYKRVVGKPFRVILEHVQKPDKEDPTRLVTFAQVTDSFLKSERPDLDVSEQLAAMGAKETGSYENSLEADLG